MLASPVLQRWELEARDAEQHALPSSPFPTFTGLVLCFAFYLNFQQSSFVLFYLIKC